MNKYDVIVFGAGSAGFSAALQSARNGAKTLLVEKRSFLGGTNTACLVGPLSPFIGQNGQIVTGIPQEIIDGFKEFNIKIEHLEDPIGFAQSLTPLHFNVMKLILFKMVKQESNLDLLLNSLVVDINVKNHNINEVTIISGEEKITIAGKIIIDATGDAVISHKAGVTTYYGDDNNKAQPMTMIFSMKNVDLDKIRDYVATNTEDFVVNDKIINGERMDYVAISGFFELVNKGIADGKFNIPRDRLLFFQGTADDEVFLNTTRVLNKNATKSNDITQATLEASQQIIELAKFLIDEIPGFKDAHINEIGEIGIRESRRIKGIKTLEALDIKNGNSQDESIAVGCYPIDIHSPDGKNMNYHDDDVSKEYEIDRWMLANDQIKNLLTIGRCFSVTHEALGSSRLTATLMSMGASAGTWAALASKQNNNLSNVDYNDLKIELIKNNIYYKKRGQNES